MDIYYIVLPTCSCSPSDPAQADRSDTDPRLLWPTFRDILWVCSLFCFLFKFLFNFLLLLVLSVWKLSPLPHFFYVLRGEDKEKVKSGCCEQNDGFISYLLISDSLVHRGMVTEAKDDDSPCPCSSDDPWRSDGGRAT